jgi:DNA-binding IclR family transcriptional regulator
MTPKALLQNKRRKSWSDLQLLVLLELGGEASTFTRLMDATGGSNGGVWNSLVLLRREELVRVSAGDGRILYSLTTTGQMMSALAQNMRSSA